jgi:DNA-directed RNA polymerase subunit RPC12/RpoP
MNRQRTAGFVVSKPAVHRQYFDVMNVCPHCNASVNPLRLLTMTRRAPYRCGRCGGHSLLRPKHNTIAALLTLVVVFIGAALAMSSLGVIKVIAAILGLYVFVIGGIMWTFMRLQPVQK